MNANSPELKSFVDVPSDSDFPIQNLPFGVFRTKDGDAHCGCAIGDKILDLSVLESYLPFHQEKKYFATSTLNHFLEQGKPVWKSVRSRISELLRHDQAELRDNSELLSKVLVEQSQVCMQLPVSIGDYTDFYSSKEHASNVGSMFRDPKNPLLPNWTHIPVGYHGRASSIVVSGTDVTRPFGQVLTGELPTFATCAKLDFELELAFVVGTGSQLGKPLSMKHASDHIFGLALMNDWSARDIQKWEYVPLGPFVSKSFATSVSPWLVTLDALEPFLTKGPEQEPKPMSYIKAEGLAHYDIDLSVSLKNQNAFDMTKICETNAKYLYWSMEQQLVHHTVTGCNVRTGDLMASGTISGKTKNSYGSLLELSWNGSKPLMLGESSRSFLEDGDEVFMEGACRGKGYRVGFGSLSGKVLPASAF